MTPLGSNGSVKMCLEVTNVDCCSGRFLQEMTQAFQPVIIYHLISSGICCNYILYLQFMIVLNNQLLYTLIESSSYCYYLKSSTVPVLLFNCFDTAARTNLPASVISAVLWLPNPISPRSLSILAFILSVESGMFRSADARIRICVIFSFCSFSICISFLISFIFYSILNNYLFY